MQYMNFFLNSWKELNEIPIEVAVKPYPLNGKIIRKENRVMKCPICSKKQNPLIQDFELNEEHRDIRICAKCKSSLRDLYHLAKLGDSKYLEAKDEFLSNPIQDTETKKALDSEIEEMDAVYQETIYAAEAETESKRQQEAFEERIRNFLATNSFNFEGYSIDKYLGIVCGDSVLGTGFLSELSVSAADWLGSESNRFSEKIEEAREKAMYRMLVKADKLGANAMIAVSFSYSNFSGNVIGVVATGTAVVVSKQV